MLLPSLVSVSLGPPSLELLGNAALFCPLGLTIFYSIDTSTDVGDVLQGLPTATEHDHSHIAVHALSRIPSTNTSLPIGDYKRCDAQGPPRAADLGLHGRPADLHKVAGMTLEAVVSEVLHKFVS